MTDVDTDINEARRRKLYMEAKRIGLSRDDRIELAQVILRRDITSWKDLDDDQAIRMLDAIEGFALINWMLVGRPA